MPLPQSLRVSLSGAGFLGAFHLGFAEALLASRVAATHRVEIAGASAGALVGAIIVTETPISAARAVLRKLAASARGAGALGIVTPGYSLIDAVRSDLDEHLPSDAHAKASASGLYVALTDVVSGSVRHVSSWATRDELIECVCASSDIPGLTGLLRATASSGSAPPDPDRTLLQRAINRDTVDGGIFDLHPDPWRDSGMVVDVHHVSPFAGAGLAVAPAVQPSTALSLAIPVGHGRSIEASRSNFMRAMHSLRPPSDEILEAYEREGRVLAEAFLARVVVT